MAAERCGTARVWQGDAERNLPPSLERWRRVDDGCDRWANRLQIQKRRGCLGRTGIRASNLLIHNIFRAREGAFSTVLRFRSGQLRRCRIAAGETYMTDARTAQVLSVSNFYYLAPRTRFGAHPEHRGLRLPTYFEPREPDLASAGLAVDRELERLLHELPHHVSVLHGRNVARALQRHSNRFGK